MKPRPKSTSLVSYFPRSGSDATYSFLPIFPSYRDINADLFYFTHSRRFGLLFLYLPFESVQRPEYIVNERRDGFSAVLRIDNRASQLHRHLIEIDIFPDLTTSPSSLPGSPSSRYTAPKTPFTNLLLFSPPNDFASSIDSLIATFAELHSCP